ncbi:hypothetical protein CDAR_481001 [Caerostris darwini]|uniref:Uncharacterized protein n=1 Tax=Caerostris darwini TaxID=1538125 RepID=A0AAV4W5Q4_9ARAC|nr:hypothetical protein CDAR_481001 [Caerostris darwini]
MTSRHAKFKASHFMNPTYGHVPRINVPEFLHFLSVYTRLSGRSCQSPVMMMIITSRVSTNDSGEGVVFPELSSGTVNKIVWAAIRSGEES